MIDFEEAAKDYIKTIKSKTIPTGIIDSAIPPLLDEIAETAYKTGYLVGYDRGVVDATKKETPCFV